LWYYLFMSHEDNNLPHSPLVLPTERDGLILRQLSAEDAQAYFEAYAASRKEIADFDSKAPTKYLTISEVEESILSPENPDRLRMGIWDGETFVGSINMTPFGETAEIGYWLDTRYTGHGYATMATSALSRYGIRHFDKLFAHVDAKDAKGNERVNEGSVAVLERAGFKRAAEKIGQLLVFELEASETRIVQREDVDKLFSSLEARASNIPELASVMELASQDPERVYEVYSQYASILHRMAGITDDEKKQVRYVWSKLAATRADIGSASRTNVADILDRLGSEGPDIITEAALQSVDQDSPYFDRATGDLIDRMERGHQFKVEGKTPKDGDPESDGIIWGHTQITDADTLLHFTVSHYFERYFSQVLEAEGNGYKKDFLLNAITDILILDHYGDNKFSDVFSKWREPRSYGGLGWIKEDRLEAFESSVK
jgi:RimJ/RimL family protein N-acetyltransferase